MGFKSPYLLLFLLAVPVGIWAYVWLDRRRGQRAAAWSRPALLPNMVVGAPGRRRYVTAGLFALAMTLFLVGFARPEAKFKTAQNGATVVILVDTSGSMAADDVKPTRLLAADGALTAFVKKLPSQYRAALVTFSTGIAVKVPPTYDRDALIANLPKTTELEGTALGDAISEATLVAKKAVGAGKPGTHSPASILLVSDGGSNAGRTTPTQAATAARKAGITVSTIAVGTPAGQVSQKVPLGTGGKTFPVVRQVPVDPSALQTVARAGGGTFAAAGTATQLNQVYKNLGKRLIYSRQLREVTEIVAGAGLLVMLAGVALSAFWFRRLI